MLKRKLLALVPLALCFSSCQPAPEAADGPPDIEAAIERIESGLLPSFVIEGEPVETPALVERMADLKVPGVGVAVIRGSKIHDGPGPDSWIQRTDRLLEILFPLKH